MSNNLGEVLVIGLDIMGIIESIGSSQLVNTKTNFEDALNEFLVTVYGNQSQSSI